MSLLVHWMVVAVALWVASDVVPGVRLSSWSALLIGAAVLGVVNTVVRPVMAILTLPITILTLGLFYLVVNGAAFGWPPRSCQASRSPPGWRRFSARLSPAWRRGSSAPPWRRLPGRPSRAWRAPAREARDTGLASPSHQSLS